MSDNNVQVVEINGIKMEIDMRHAKRIDTFRVGSKVKVLRKGYNEYKVHPGVVVGFEPFKALPTIIVCYVVIDYAGAKLEFCYYNADSKKEEIEIVMSVDDDIMTKKSEVLAQIDREITKKEEELADIQRKRDYFLQHFNCYFEQASAQQKLDV